MTFSGINVEQRSKEVQALKSFLAYSLIGSLALHIGVLSSGIGNYLTRMPEDNDESIEVAIVDPPTAEPEKPLEEIPEEPKKEPQIVQKQPIETPQIQQIIEKPKIQPVPEQTIQKPQPQNREIAPKPEVAARSVTPSTNQSSQQLRDVLSGIRDSRANENPGGGGGTTGVLTGLGSGVAVGTGTGSGSGTGSGIGSGSGSGVGSGTGSGIGSGTGSGIGNQPANPPVAAAPTVPTPPKINNSGTSNGRAACRKCDFKYPESFKRRGIEGRTGLAFDTDDQGNVTNVRIASSSGNRELDEEHLRQAREWKFNPAQGGRRGVRVNSAAFKENSRQYRQYQQERRRETEQRTQQATASNSNTTEGTSRRRRREFTPSTNQAATATRGAESGFNRRLRRQTGETTSASSSSQRRTTSSQGAARETLRRIRSERTTTNSSQKPQASTIRRRRRDNTSQNKLRDSLRRLRQPQSQPAAPSQQ